LDGRSAAIPRGAVGADETAISTAIVHGAHAAIITALEERSRCCGSAAMSDLFDSRSRCNAPIDDVAINFRVGGVGPHSPAHGFPQTHVIWHRVARCWRRNYTGDAGLARYAIRQPEAVRTTPGYSKRTLRATCWADAAFASNRFTSASDRGGRVAHRLAARLASDGAQMMLLEHFARRAHV